MWMTKVRNKSAKYRRTIMVICHTKESMMVHPEETFSVYICVYIIYRNHSIRSGYEIKCFHNFCWPPHHTRNIRFSNSFKILLRVCYGMLHTKFMCFNIYFIFIPHTHTHSHISTINILHSICVYQ